MVKMPYSASSNAPGDIPIGHWIILLSLLFLSSSPVLSEQFRGFGIVAFSIFILWKNCYLGKKAILIFLIAMLPLMPMTAYDFIRSVSEGFSTLSFLFIPASLMLGWLAAQLFKVGGFAYVFERSMFTLSLLSLVLFALLLLFPSIIAYFPEYTYGDFTSKSIFFLNVLIGDDVIYRNSGFASEPGLFQFFVNAALYISLVQQRKIRVYHAVYVLTVLSTISTAGLLIMTATLLFFSRGYYRVIIVFGSIIFSNQIFDLFLQHWSAKVSNEYAFMGRIDPALNAAKVFLENPFGIGAVRYAEIYRDSGIGAWDSYTQIAVRYGVLGLATLGFFLFCIARKGFGLFLVFAVSFATNSMWPFAICSCFYFVESRAFWKFPISASVKTTQLRR